MVGIMYLEVEWFARVLVRLGCNINSFDDSAYSKESISHKRGPKSDSLYPEESVLCLWNRCMSSVKTFGG